jgi:VCBS repeat-containing protein
MSTTNKTSGLISTSLINPLTVSTGLSTTDLFTLDGAKAVVAPGLAACNEARANNGYLNAAAVADGTYISISIAGTGAVAGDVLEVFFDGQLVSIASHVLLAEEISNVARSTAGVTPSTTTSTGDAPVAQAGIGVVPISAAMLAALGDGTHTITSRIHYTGSDTYSGISTAIGRIKIDTVSPTAPTAPIATDDIGQVTGVIAQDATTDDANPLISGTVKEVGSSIEVFDNGVSLGKAVVSSTGGWIFVPITPLNNGPHAITLVETDKAGNSSPMSAPLKFIVDTGVANVVITHAIDNAGDIQGKVQTDGVTDDNTPTLVGTAKANAVVTILDGNTIVGTTAADGSGNWSFTPSGAQSEGAHTYTASTSVAGNTVTSMGFVITVDTIAPDVVITPQGDNLKTAAEATAATGIITVDAELGSTSTVTFVGQQGQVTKTITNIGSPRPVVLTAAELATLGDGAVEVTTVTKDKAGNITTTPDGADGDFTLDTVAPVAVTDVVNATEDLVSTSGNVGTNDTSKDGSETFSLVGSATGLYGTLVLGANGNYIYTRTSNLDAIQATVTDAFSYQVRDGAGNITQSTLKINMAPVNDAAVISGVITGSVTEAGGVANTIAGTPTATGTLTSIDVDGVNNAFTAVAPGANSIGGYGTYAMTAGGVWTYTLNNANATVQGLTAGATLQDTFTVTAADGTAKTISVTITGTNDAAEISGNVMGTVTEAAGGTASGTLSSIDVDGAANAFTAINAGTASYGSFTMTTGGVWTYTLDNSNPTVQALGASGTLTDTFTVTAADGTAQLIKVTISGSNNAAVISGTTAGTVIEAGGVANAIAGTPTATGTLTSTDVDGANNAFTAVTTGTSSISGYGTYTMTANGVWTYTLNNANATVQALGAGATLQDTFTVTAADGTPQTITVSINGTNDAAVISGTIVGNVTEAGGVANAIAGTPAATGMLTSTDVDGVNNAFTAVAAGTATTGGYGTYAMSAAGVWTYTLNNANATVQALGAGATLQDTFTVTAADGTTKIITVTINGTNDAAVIGGVSTASLTQNAVAQTASGTLSITDVDSAATFVAQTNVAGSNGYGKFSVNAAGAWTYSMNTAHAEFVAGTAYTDSITVASADGTTQVITVTINGTNDAAVIGGTVSGSVLEAGGVANAIAGTPTATGTLTSTDVDGTANAFTAVAAGTATASGYGSYVMSAAGVWTYTLNNANATVQALGAGATLLDAFIVTAADGTTQVITVTINGTNDAAVIGGTVSGAVVEAGGVANAIAGTPTATGTLTSTDVDGTANAFTAVAGTASSGGYGTYAMSAAGVWTYTLNNANATVQALGAGATLQDTFTVKAADGTAKLITVTITGSNDAAVVAGTSSADLIETGTVQTFTGSLTSSDVDGTDNLFQARAFVGTYGSFSMDTAGQWTYAMNGIHAEFVEGTVYTDSCIVKAADGTPQTLIVKITGTNDAAIIGGVITGVITETNAAQSVTGTLTITDVDSAATFQAVTGVVGTSGFGSFSLTAAGVWTYTMNGAHNEFVAGTAYTDSFTINYPVCA